MPMQLNAFRSVAQQSSGPSAIFPPMAPGNDPAFLMRYWTLFWQQQMAAAQFAHVAAMPKFGVEAPTDTKVGIGAPAKFDFTRLAKSINEEKEDVKTNISKAAAPVFSMASNMPKAPW
jgi:hypothetical protein